MIAELAIAKAFKGLLMGFIFGVVEEWNEKVLVATIFGFAVLYFVALIVVDPSAETIAEPFKPLWAYAILLAFFFAGISAGRQAYREATA